MQAIYLPVIDCATVTQVQQVMMQTRCPDGVLNWTCSRGAAWRHLSLSMSDLGMIHDPV